METNQYTIGHCISINGLYSTYLILCSCNQNRNNKSNDDGISVVDDERQTSQTYKKETRRKRKAHIFL